MRFLNRRYALVSLMLIAVAAPGTTMAEAPEPPGPGPEASAESETGTLIVRVEDLSSDDGNLRFALFDSEKEFMRRPVRAGIVDISDRQGVWTAADLPFGTYAVLVHHDSNGSGKMERHWYGKPKEPTGASNDAPAKFGPPKFKDAKFTFESEELTLTVPVR